MSALLAGLLLSRLALAGAVGEPLPDARAGAWSLVATGDAGFAPVTERGCARTDRCAAWWRDTRAGARAGLVLLPGVELTGEASWVRSAVHEAAYEGLGPAWSAGLRAALPVGGSWLAVGGRYGQGSGAGAALDAGGRQRTAWREADGWLLAAWREPGGDGVAAWGGVQGVFAWDLVLQPLGGHEGAPALHLALDRRAEGVVGASLTSDPLGAGFRRSARLTLGLEARAGAAVAASTWIGVRY